MVFPAKVDFWFLALFYGCGIAMLLAGPFLARVPRGRITAALLVVIGLLFVGVGWRTSTVEYVITEDGHLDATGWPFDGRITRLDAVHRIEPSNDPRASHAASLDRLRIDHGEGGVIFIAVHDQAAFLDAAVAADPGLERTPEGARRTQTSTRGR